MKLRCSVLTFRNSVDDEDGGSFRIRSSIPKISATRPRTSSGNRCGTPLFMNCWKYAWFFPTFSDNSDSESPSSATRETIALRAASIGEYYIIFRRCIIGFFLLRENRILPIIVEDRQRRPLLCSSVLGPRAALRSCTEISSGGIVRNPSGAAPERRVMPAVRHRTSIAIKYRRKGKELGPGERRIRPLASKRNGRMPPLNRKEAGSADPTKSLRKADFAFQRVMRTAVARGLEHPPMIGVFKDARPLNARPPSFDPVPHSSGCA